jgi:hypothetical protein
VTSAEERKSGRQRSREKGGERLRRRWKKERKRQAAQQRTESRERALSGREWRKKLNFAEALRTKGEKKLKCDWLIA